MKPKHLILAARHYGPPENERRVTTPMLLTRVGQLEREVYQSVAAHDGRPLAAVAEFNQTAINTALTNGTPIAMPAKYAIIGGHAYVGSVSTDLTFIPEDMRNELPEYHPAAYHVGQNLYLAGVAADWTTVTKLAINYVPVPPLLETVDQDITLPPAAETYLTLALADWLLTRVGQKDEVLAAEAQTALAALVQSLISRDLQEISTVRVR